MHKEQNQDEEKYIPAHLLDDDDRPTSATLKPHPHSYVAFSAPPILFNLTYRIEEDFFEQYPTSQQTASLSPQKWSYEEIKQQVTEFQSISMSTRKLSLQNQEEYASYCSYQNISLPKINFYPVYSAEEEILSNLGFLGEWAKDQAGSRNMQIALENGSQLLRTKVYQAVSSKVNTLCYDKFGNYVIQKLLEVGNEHTKYHLSHTIKREMLFMSLHHYACRVVQKIIEIAVNNIQQQQEIFNSLELHLLQLFLNQNGNHIAQKIIEIFSPKVTIPIGQLIAGQLSRLAFHSFGCRVVQRYLETGFQSKARESILEQLIGMTVQLSKCQFGNYIMQHIVCNPSHLQEHILAILLCRLGQLSCNKFASNVVQKFIKNCKSSSRQELSRRLLQDNQLQMIAKNQFGNYVVQSLLERSDKETRDRLGASLRENSQNISKSQYGRHVLLQLQKYR